MSRFAQSRWSRAHSRSMLRHWPDRDQLHGSGLCTQEMDVNDWNSPTTKLLTLLNVSAAKSLKRKCTDQQISHPHKLDKRRVLDHISPNSALGDVNADETVDIIVEQKDDGDAEMNEASEPSDTGGMCHPWSSRYSADWTMRKSPRTNSTLDQCHPF